MASTEFAAKYAIRNMTNSIRYSLALALQNFNSAKPQPYVFRFLAFDTHSSALL